MKVLMGETSMVEKNKKTVNIKDVAALAGVSIATISRYLNGDLNRMSAKTADKVRDAIEMLHYVPNSTARQMITKSSKMIAVMVANIDDYFSSELFKGASSILESAGYIGAMFDVDADMEREKKLLSAIGRQVFDGLIIQPLNTQADVKENLHRELPIVVVDRESDQSYWPQVVTDNYEVSRQVTQHFSKLGYKHVIVLTSEVDLARPRQDRFKGIQSVTDNIDLVEVSEASYNHAAVYQKLKTLIENASEPTLIFTLKERWLLEFVLDLVNKGYISDGKIMVTGFSDTDTARRLDPNNIHLIAQNPYLMGASAAEVLLKQLKGETIPEKRIVQPAKFG